ncbi:AAA family ATPase [Clostridium sediminicola]|uniref:AAA family ATPase n=1 Tax=Clostridium sediminicola TaxID=3114879 RepID=UPI0031F1F951
MELLFIWINKSKNKFIQKKDFNFSPQHKFSCELDGDKVVLRYEMVNAIDKRFLYENNVLNVTAIVGENGSGKTTLLQYIYDCQCYPKAKIRDEAYRQMHEEEYEENKTILVYENNDNIVIYNNIDNTLFKNTTDFQVKSLSIDDQTRKDELRKELESSTIIYLTNSLYTYGHTGYTTHGSLNRISLTPDSIRGLSNVFYKKVVQHSESFMIKQTSYDILQKILIKNKKETDFQQICDVLYFHHLISNGLLDTYIAKINSEIEVNFSMAISLIKKEYPDIIQWNYIADNKRVEGLSQTIKKFSKWLKNIQRDLLSNVCCKLYLNLLFEISYCFKIELNAIEISEIEQFPNIIDVMLSEHKVKDGNDEQAIVDYYKYALHEVKNISSVLIDCKEAESNVPQSDLAHNNSRVLSLNEDPERYTKFCDMINSMAKEKQSFVIKYITIRNLHMSSGERAFQNTFSWLNLLPFFNQVIEKESASIQKSILILIDEVDLYAHPEWQRKYIKVLLNDVSKQFKDNNVQIIFTTHSPIVLSDILKESTIYLSKTTDKCIVDDSALHKQTFGSNIHTLLNDAFYMSSTMGEFSRSKIEEVYAELAEYLKNNFKGKLKASSQDYKLFIESIGEPLIKNKLSELYKKCFPVDKDATIISYQSQIEGLKRQLLESSGIDKDKVEEAKNKLSETLEIIKSI